MQSSERNINIIISYQPPILVISSSLSPGRHHDVLPLFKQFRHAFLLASQAKFLSLILFLAYQMTLIYPPFSDPRSLSASYREGSSIMNNASVLR